MDDKTVSAVSRLYTLAPDETIRVYSEDAYESDPLSDDDLSEFTFRVKGFRPGYLSFYRDACQREIGTSDQTNAQAIDQFLHPGCDQCVWAATNAKSDYCKLTVYFCLSPQ